MGKLECGVMIGKDQMPIRMWPGETSGYELRFHVHCANHVGLSSVTEATEGGSSWPR